MVMQGYYKNPEATAEIIDSDGWLHTGDVGYMDSNNFVILTGRAKNIIVTEGGKNVFPEEIEDHFQLYYDIEQICVLGYMEDKVKKSEGICALIYPSDDYKKRESDPEERYNHMLQIVEEVNKELLPYQRIRHIALIDEPMEMSSTKKIKRFVVKKKYGEIIDGFSK
jgi:long-chain acyl-CoA synthetase